ncbi:hypothetical protein C0389_07705 [bacterium]|nr:hypothetical protein [bacterium]
MKKHLVYNPISLKKILILIIFSFSFIYSNLSGQSKNTGEVYGIVTDSLTGKPIEYATVFLANTSLGVLTNKNGAYVIKNIPPGAYSLVAALIGYSKVVKPVKVSNGTQKIDVALSGKAIVAKEITVIGENPSEWQRQLRIFTKEFLGESSNADNCEILNPEIIDFEINKNTDELSAKAEDAIVIVNHSLGYKIKIYLKEFVWSRSEGDGKYQIYPFFEEVNSSDEKEKNNWQVNRVKAYKGSFRHFLKSCAEGRVYEEGFRISKSYVSSHWIYTDRSDSLLNQKKTNLDTLLYSRIKKNNKDEYCLVCDSLMQVVYLHQGEELNYKNYRERLNGNATFSLIRGFNLKREKYTTEIKPYQSSWVIFPNGELFFNSTGICSDDSPYGKKLAGYWAWKRVADLLPYDYKYSLTDESGN